MWHLNFNGSLVIIATMLPFCIRFPLGFVAITIFHGLNMVLFAGCFLLVVVWFRPVAVVNVFVMCLVTVDVSLVISSSSSHFLFVAAIAVVVACCSRGIVDAVFCHCLVSFCSIGDLWHSDIVLVGSWVVLIVFWPFWLMLFLVPWVLPSSGGILGLKYVVIDCGVGESATFGFIMVVAATGG